jgi:tetratricopeptide (TPR) repeat protein
VSAQSDLAGFAEAFAQEHYAEALSRIDRLIATYADSPALRWNRVECLEKLKRYGEIKAELDLLLRLEPDHVPAIVKRVQYAHFGDETASKIGNGQTHREGAERSRPSSWNAEDELRRALMLNPDHVDALHLLANELRGRTDWTLYQGETEALLDRAIELAPERPDLLETRANLHHDGGAPADDDPLNSEMRYSRPPPELFRNDLGVDVSSREGKPTKHDDEFKRLKWILSVFVVGVLALIIMAFWSG